MAGSTITVLDTLRGAILTRIPEVAAVTKTRWQVARVFADGEGVPS